MHWARGSYIVNHKGNMVYCHPYCINIPLIKSLWLPLDHHVLVSDQHRTTLVLLGLFYPHIHLFPLLSVFLISPSYSKSYYLIILLSYDHWSISHMPIRYLEAIIKDQLEPTSRVLITKSTNSCQWGPDAHQESTLHSQQSSTTDCLFWQSCLNRLGLHKLTWISKVETFCVIWSACLCFLTTFLFLLYHHYHYLHCRPPLHPLPSPPSMDDVTVYFLSIGIIHYLIDTYITMRGTKKLKKCVGIAWKFGLPESFGSKR